MRSAGSVAHARMTASAVSQELVPTDRSACTVESAGDFPAAATCWERRPSRHRRARYFRRPRAVHRRFARACHTRADCPERATMPTRLRSPGTGAVAGLGHGCYQRGGLGPRHHPVGGYPVLGCVADDRWRVPCTARSLGAGPRSRSRARRPGDRTARSRATRWSTPARCTSCSWIWRWAPDTSRRKPWAWSQVLPQFGFDLPDVLVDLLTVIAPRRPGGPSGHGGRGVPASRAYRRGGCGAACGRTSRPSRWSCAHCGWRARSRRPSRRGR